MIPLELWDLTVGPDILWQRMEAPDFPAVLATALAALRRGEGATRSEGPVPAAIAGFDALHVAGGRSEEPPLRAALAALGLPVTFSPTPRNPGATAGLRLLHQRGSATPWICDLGQASLKLSCATDRRQFPRDRRRLPLRTDRPGEPIDEQRRQLRAWVGESLRLFAETAPAPDGLLFALPSRLDDAGLPEGSSYVGMAGDADLIADTLAGAGLSPRLVLTLNDAELAALEALAEPPVPSARKTLVITLGFGLGAALVIHGESSPRA